MNPCSVASPQQDIEGDGRWNSIVSFVLNKMYYLLFINEIFKQDISKIKRTYELIFHAQ